MGPDWSFLSGLCAVHCLITPLLCFPCLCLRKKFESPWVHIVMAFFVVPVGLFAFWSGYRHHRKANIFWTGMTGLTLIGAAALMPQLGVYFLRDDLITIIGSFFLLAAHFLNRRACACHRH